MAYNGSGTFNLASGNPVVTGTTISSTWANTTLSDIATGLSNVICKDGQSTPTANLPMGNYKFTGLAAGTSNGDSVRYEQVTSAVAITGGTINGTTIGATTPSTGAFTTLSASSTVTLSGGTANGVAYLDASKNVTSGSALTFDGTKKLSIVSSANSELVLDSSAAGTSILSFLNSTGAEPIIGYSGGAASSLRFGSVTGASAAGFSEQMRLTSTGLGIGTSSPNQKLQVYTSAGTGGQIQIGNSATGAGSTDGVLFGFDASNDVILTNQEATAIKIINATAREIAFYTTNTERMRIDSSGNVGIGTSSPSYKLDVAGQIRSSSSGYVFPDGTTKTTNAAAQITVYTSGSGTYTVPTGAKYLIVQMVGGGGGGAGGGNNVGSGLFGSSGGTTTFGTLSCTGGSGGSQAASSAASAGGTPTIGAGWAGLANAGGQGNGGNSYNIAGYAAGMMGATTPLGGGGASAANAGGGGGVGNSGAGGGGGGTTSAGGGSGGGGAAGAYIYAVTTSLSATYSYAIGGGGGGGAAGTNGYAGGSGAGGSITIVAYF